MSGALKLWFFRDLTDEQRLKLFGLFGMPVNQIGNVQGRQAIALDHIVRKITDAVKEELTVAAKSPPDHRHDFVPNRKYPWFCGYCGYPPHEPLKHFQAEGVADE